MATRYIIDRKKVTICFICGKVIEENTGRHLGDVNAHRHCITDFMSLVRYEQESVKK